jgi:hypothetical protein
MRNGQSEPQTSRGTEQHQGRSNGRSGIEAWRLVGREQLALLAGHHPDEISRATKRGMPVLEPGAPGRSGVYDAVAALEWFRARRGGTAEAERARRDAAQAALTEQTVKARAKDLLPRGEVQREWARAFSAIKTGLLQVPPAEAEKLAQIAVEHGAAGVEARLEEVVRRVLTELATAEAP